MAAWLDHITVVAPSLQAGSRYVHDALGIAPGPGRKHDGMGTHNLLLALGDSMYLEVIAPDPDVPAPLRRRWFGLDHVNAGEAPRLAAWVARTDDIVAAAIPELGVVETMHRAEHSWQMTLTADGSLPLDGAVPSLIQRTAASAHPASALPDVGLRFRRLHVRHPDAEAVMRALARMELASFAEIAVSKGPACTLMAEIETPDGMRQLR